MTPSEIVKFRLRTNNGYNSLGGWIDERAGFGKR
jgi:hypothetical protein